ncbi:MAG: YigZ family protein [Firmicutes bacterium]|nr:YigZ family protein [Bacillota bacterium]
MEDRYNTIYKFGFDEFVEKKSRFIGYAKPISSEKEANEFIEKIKSKHRDATHNVPAYVFGENNIVQRYSDDGEPSGTAGIPVLEVIKKEDLRNMVIVVTRYFGGVKLGAGGLVRAYTQGAKIAIEASKKIEKILHKIIKIRIDYTLYGKVENELMKLGYNIDEVNYDDQVNLITLCQKGKTKQLYELITNITSAKAEIHDIGEDYYSVLEGKILKK